MAEIASVVGILSPIFKSSTWSTRFSKETALLLASALATADSTSLRNSAAPLLKAVSGDDSNESSQSGLIPSTVRPIKEMLRSPSVF